MRLPFCAPNLRFQDRACLDPSLDHLAHMCPSAFALRFDSRDPTNQPAQPVFRLRDRREFAVAHLLLHLAQMRFRDLLEGIRHLPGDRDLNVVAGNAEGAVAEIDAGEPSPGGELGRRRHVLFAVVDPKQPPALDRIDADPVGFLAVIGFSTRTERAASTSALAPRASLAVESPASAFGLRR